MLNSYFEKYGHKCYLGLNDPLDSLLVGKSSWRRWHMKHSVISQDYILLRTHPRSFASLRNEMLCQLKFFPYTLHPFSWLTYHIDFIWMITIFCWFIVKPFDVFKNISPLHTDLYELSISPIRLLFSIVGIVDCGRRFFTGYLIRNCDSDETILSLRRIANRYFRTYFFFDFVSCIPAVIKVIYDVPTPYYIVMEIFSFARIVRLSSMKHSIENVMRFYQFSHNFIEIFNSITTLTLIVHWVSCFSVLLGVIQRVFNPNVTEWYDYILTPNCTLMDLYISCIHRSLSILTGAGYKFYLQGRDHVNDMIYTIFTVILGHIITVVMFAKVYEIVNGLRSSSAKYEEMLSEISNYMQHRNLSKTVQHKIKKYYEFKYNNSYFDEQELLEIIPSSLRHNTLMHRANALLTNMTMFKKLPESVLANIVARLSKEILMAGDVIFRSGAHAHSIYFILTGTIAAFTYSGKEISHIEDGGEFGQISLLSGNTAIHFCTAVVIETTELFKLHKKDFLELIEIAPDLVEFIQKLAKDRRHVGDMLEERYKQALNNALVLADSNPNYKKKRISDIS